MRSDDGKALADVLTGLAQRFGAPSGPANDDDPFARRGPGGGPGSSGSALSPSSLGASSSPAQSVTGRELLLGSAFHFAGGGDGSGPGLAAWGPSARVGAVGEERELLMALALNRARVASQRDLAVAWWGPAELGKHWDLAVAWWGPADSDWMRARVRYRLDATRGIERQRGAGGDA